MKQILFTTALIVASAVAGEANAVCSGLQITDTGTGTQEKASVKFRALTAGQSTTVAGLTFTATTARSDAQVANAYKSLLPGATTGPGVGGTYSGVLTGWTAASTSNSPRVFTSVLFGNVTDIVVTSTATLKPVVTTTQGAGAPSMSSLLTGKTVCVGATGNWAAQEFHKSGGDLIDWKKGAGHPTDPTKSVGSWSITGTNTATRVNYTYGASTYSNVVWQHNDGTYSFCNQSGNETIPSSIKSGQVGC